MNIGISKAGWQALTADEQTVVRFVLSRLRLGNPAIYVTPTDERWFTFDDLRIDLLDIAVIGCFAANRADWPLAYQIPMDGGEVDKVQLRSDVAGWLTNPARTTPFVHPDNVTPSDTDVGVTGQDVLDANGAPAVLRSGALPDTWVPYDPEVHGAV